MSTVYVVQDQQTYDPKKRRLAPKYPALVKKAEEYGEVKFLLSPSAAPWNTQTIVEELETKLANFSDTDYILLIGSPVFMGLAVAIAALNNDGRVRFLQWSGKDKKSPEEPGRYIPLSATLDMGEEFGPEEYAE